MKRYQVIIAVAFCSLQHVVHGMEKMKELYHYLMSGQQQQEQQSKQQADVVQPMLDFVTTGLHDIDTRVNPHEISLIMHKGMLKDIELIPREWEEEDLDQKLNALYKQAKNYVARSSDKQELVGLQEKLAVMRNDLELHREGLPFLLHRIGKNTDMVMGTMRDALKQLEIAARNSGFTIYKAYEILGFDADKRAQITPTQIRLKYEQLGKKMKGTQTPLGAAVRQAGYILQSPYGKQNYDAFLSDYLNAKSQNKEVKRLVIPEEVAKILKIDYAIFNTFITTAKSYVDELQKVIEKRLIELK